MAGCTQEEVENEAHWVSGSTQQGCVVLVERDPAPGALAGHMSFGNFNPEIEKLQVATLELYAYELLGWNCICNVVPATV